MDCFQADQLSVDSQLTAAQDGLITLDTISWDQPFRNGDLMMTSSSSSVELPVIDHGVDNVPVTGECAKDVLVPLSASLAENLLGGDDPWLVACLSDLEEQSRWRNSDRFQEDH